MILTGLGLAGTGALVYSGPSRAKFAPFNNAKLLDSRPLWPPFSSSFIS
ncbi:hypothetical protein Hden_1450 [Hyphomicrobium denitrificans ATCC 51888]|uniref:Uncharacterized protein n=1 Tax=Hyphomicrobium denitrificans (strain ATCC 51888 / DSM 1869 / NCIMB 11706 / TK 0415) TaxID=582899 RepID=D8JXQ3_HYPDA|nr:hypothetical protein Hden_1450 [Hyphomicrobium denitrificans ATCC 51888]